MSNGNQQHQGDNLFGICHGLGDALGINPLYLRIAFAAGLLFDAKLAVLTYAALGAVVLADKLVTRLSARRRTAQPAIRQFA